MYLNEFLDTGKVTKLENINNSTKLLENNRILEVIKLLTKYTAIEFYECLVTAYSDFAETDKARKRADKFEFLKELDYLLIGRLDVFNEDMKNVSDEYQKVINSFNKMIGFDFNENDIPVIKQIMSRYEVYNTLYDLDKAPKD